MDTQINDGTSATKTTAITLSTESEVGEQMDITQDINDETTPVNNTTNQEKLVEVEGQLNQPQPSTSGLEKKKKMTGEQILAILEKGLCYAPFDKKVSLESHVIANLNEAKEVINKKLESIKILSKISIKVVCDIGECLYTAKDICKKTQIVEKIFE